MAHPRVRDCAPHRRRTRAGRPRAAALPAAGRGDGAGRLSYSQVRAISRIDQPGEHEHGLVDDLIEVARHGTAAQLEVVVRGLRTVDHNDKATDPGEYLKRSWSSDSRCQLSARLEPERGALVGAAIDAIMQRDGCSPVEALERLAAIALTSLADAKKPARELRGDERAAIVIHLQAAQVPPRSAACDASDTAIHEVPVPRSAERVRRIAAAVAHRPAGASRVPRNATPSIRLPQAMHLLPGRTRGSLMARVCLTGWCSGCCATDASAP